MGLRNYDTLKPIKIGERSSPETLNADDSCDTTMSQEFLFQSILLGMGEFL